MIKKNVVVIGGGNGSAIVLDALKHEADKLQISAVVSVCDSGGSSGVLRKQFKQVPPGDILRAVLGLSSYDYRLLKTIFYSNRFVHLKKFKIEGAIRGLKGHNLGNLFLMLLANFEHDFMAAVRALEIAVEARGHVYPATLRLTNLVVRLSNGQEVIGEEKIDRPQYRRDLKITTAYLKPPVPVYKEVKEVVRAADYIILAPGSFYCSIVAALLPVGLKEAIAASSAKLIYVVGDAYELEGETGPEKLSDFVEQAERYLPRPLDVVMYNNCRLTARLKTRYVEKKWAQFTKDVKNIKGHVLVGADFEKSNGGLSSIKLAPFLKKIICK